MKQTLGSNVGPEIRTLINRVAWDRRRVRYGGEDGRRLHSYVMVKVKVEVAAPVAGRARQDIWQSRIATSSHPHLDCQHSASADSAYPPTDCTSAFALHTSSATFRHSTLLLPATIVQLGLSAICSARHAFDDRCSNRSSSRKRCCTQPFTRNALDLLIGLAAEIPSAQYQRLR